MYSPFAGTILCVFEFTNMHEYEGILYYNYKNLDYSRHL